ncbi:Glutamine synthetase [bioreactor metagenome]|uniref:Glutamine synthetase n=1 Tax=bioreactor metagenome TaxID=1076179 RepID=A0A645FZI6_9ZZZZ
MCGSSNNIAEPCFTLNTAVAKILSEVADVLEAADDVQAAAKKLVKELLTTHKRVIFNGNNYAEAWVEEAASRGLPNISNTVLAIKELVTDKHKELFESMGVLTEKEIDSRYEILLDSYTKTINIEALTLGDIVERQLLPATLEYALKLSKIAEKTGSVSAKARLAQLVALADNMDAKLSDLKAALVVEAEDAFEIALHYREKVFFAMEDLRCTVDATEAVVPAAVWPVPVYCDLLFKV